VNKYVLDASVAAKWFLPGAQEALVPEARRILENYAAGSIGLLVPDLFWCEIGNVLWESVRIGRISINSAHDALASLTSWRLPTAPSLNLIDDALAIACRFERSVHDAVYVALAVVANRVLVTADERLANALAARFPIRWLGSL
jgi:predicted nucleic acid-binding protein